MNNKEKLLKVILENPLTKFHIRELSRTAKLNPNTIINITQQLKKENLIKIKKKKHLVEISANTEDKKFARLKQLHNMKQLYDSGIIDYLTEKTEPEAIVSFGSYSRGEDIESSDIDLAIITNKESPPDISKFEKILGKKIHLLLINYKKISDEFYTNLINGIILHGYIKKK